MTEVVTQFNLGNVLEALLFSTSEPLSIKDIQAVISRFHDQAEKIRGKVPEGGDSTLESHLPFPLELIDDVPALITSTQIREAIDQLNQQLSDREGVYEIQETNQGFRLVVKSDHGFWVRLLREDPKPMRLSQPAMETLSIIAYRQPVVRSEMESIRGVSVDSSLQKLVEYELVYVVGRAELPGRPVQYGTTDKFLEFVGVTSLDELPSTDVLSTQQLDAWINQAEEPEHLGDADVGLPSNDEENVENQEAHLATDEDQEELDLNSADDPIYEVESNSAEASGLEEDTPQESEDEEFAMDSMDDPIDEAESTTVEASALEEDPPQESDDEETKPAEG